LELQLTGNPFVDTGLGVIAYLARCKDIHCLRLEDLIRVHGDGKTLARKNSKLKSMTMIFSNNSLATNPAIKNPEKRIQYYSALTTAIMNSIGNEDLNERCESCGNERSLDVDLLVRRTLVPLGFNDSTRYVGRDWFPLAGSMGSDAQALPAASRAPNICAKCLFAVHYLPLGVILVNGRLAVFQSTSTIFWFDLVKEIASQINDRISAGMFETLGAKEGSSAAVERLFKVMKDMRDDDLDPGTTLFLWLFSNSGTGPDCSIEEIPNSALKFIQIAANTVVNFKEIDILLNQDRKRGPDYSFLGCISRGADYEPLYPYKNFKGVSNELFATYQVVVRDVPVTQLRIANHVASYLKDTINGSKQLQRLQKQITNDLSSQNTVKKIVSEMIQKGLLTYDQYSLLFLDQSSPSIKINYDALKFLKFYLSKDSVKFPSKLERSNILNAKAQGREPEYRRRLLYVATKIFEMVIKEKGEERISMLISSIARKSVGPSWLQAQFIKLADKYPGFTYSDWVALCVGENGKDIAWEVLAQLRFIWTEWAQKKVSLEQVITNEIKMPQKAVSDEGGIAHEDQYEQLASRIVDSYLQEYGEQKLRKYVLEGLRRRDLRLYWFRQQLSRIDPHFKDDDYWEAFLQDEEGRRVPLTRLFQLHLSVRNVLRQHLFKDVRLLA
jgi:hypothetical protein